MESERRLTIGGYGIDPRIIFAECIGDAHSNTRHLCIQSGGLSNRLGERPAIDSMACSSTLARACRSQANAPRRAAGDRVSASIGPSDREKFCTMRWMPIYH